MNTFKYLLIAMLAGSALMLSGCGKKSEPAEPATEQSEHEGHDHSGHDHADHEGHNH